MNNILGCFCLDVLYLCVFCHSPEGFLLRPTVFVYNSETNELVRFSSVLLRLWSMSSPYVVNPAVNANGHEHVEVDPQGKPVFGLLVAEPVHQSGFVYFGFEAVADISWD